MPEQFKRTSPLADIAIQGRFGADHGAPGVILSVRHPALIATVIARKGKVKAFKGVIGTQSDTKRAVVTLEEGHRIDVTTGL